MSSLPDALLVEPREFLGYLVVREREQDLVTSQLDFEPRGLLLSMSAIDWLDRASSLRSTLAPTNASPAAIKARTTTRSVGGFRLMLIFTANITMQLNSRMTTHPVFRILVLRFD
jgi:hypothetical protein